MSANHKKDVPLLNYIQIDKTIKKAYYLQIKDSISKENEISVKMKELHFLKGVHIDDLKELILKIQIENNKWSGNSFTPLRKIIESVYFKLHEYDDHLLPYGCLRYDNGQVNFKYCELRITGREIRDNANIIYPKISPVVPEHIQWILGPITKICSIASHADNEKFLTKYSLETVVYGIMDFLIWFKKFVEKNH